MANAPVAGDERRITLKDARGEWPAVLEAFSGRHLRVSLSPEAEKSGVRWDAGAEVRVCLQAASGSFFAPASVIKHIGSVVWLSVPLSLDMLERRSAPRVAVRFQVECMRRGAKHPAWCLDLSSGGMRLSLATHLAQGDELALTFRLPGAEEEFRMSGRVLRIAHGPGGRVEAGVKFVDLEPAQGAAIAAFCAAHAGDAGLQGI